MPHIAVPFRSDMGLVVDGSAAGCPAWPLPQCPHAPAAVAGVRGAGAPAGSRCPAGRVRTAGTRRPRRPGPLDQRRRASATCVALASRRNGGCGSAAVLPQPAGQPDTAAGVWAAAEPDTADAVAVRCCFRNCGRCPESRCPDGRCPPWTLPQPVGVRGYRNRSSGRRSLDGGSHRRYARAS